MSAYDDAIAHLDAEVHPRCDYEIYSDMRDIVDEMEAENAKLRELLIDVSEEVPWSFMDTTKYYMPLRADKLRKLLWRMRELGVKV